MRRGEGGNLPRAPGRVLVKGLSRKIVTSKACVKISYGLSEALRRIDRGLCKKTAGRIAANAAAVREYSNGEAKGNLRYINGQGLEPVASLPFGRYPMGYNGCEVIASYNALIALGAAEPLWQLANSYENRGIFLRGRFGTHPEAIPGFFRERGHPVQSLYASAVGSCSAYDDAFAPAEVALFSFWNNEDALMEGVHTVCISHGRDGGIVVYNRRNREAEPYAGYSTIAQYIRSQRLLPIVLHMLR